MVNFTFIFILFASKFVEKIEIFKPTFSRPVLRRKLISASVELSVDLIRSMDFRCSGVDTANARVSPIASWNP